MATGTCIEIVLKKAHPSVRQLFLWLVFRDVQGLCIKNYIQQDFERIFKNRYDYLNIIWFIIIFEAAMLNKLILCIRNISIFEELPKK